MCILQSISNYEIFKQKKRRQIIYNSSTQMKIGRNKHEMYNRGC